MATGNQVIVTGSKKHVTTFYECATDIRFFAAFNYPEI